MPSFKPIRPFDSHSARLLRNALTNSIAKMLPPKTERAACLLSGGIDSSTVTAIASKLHPRVEAFTFANLDGESEDLNAARELCDACDIPLQIISARPETLVDKYLESGVAMVETFEPALVRNAVSYYFLCRGVRDAGFKFALSGEGADEVFGGYAYFKLLPPTLRDDSIQRSLSEIHRTYLQMADRASMAARLEVRVPYMEASIVQLSSELPLESRIFSTVDKRILRELFPEIIPARIRHRAKVGMNQGAGFGTNDPGESIYYQGVRNHYLRSPQLYERDRAVAEPLWHVLDKSDLEELFNAARFVELGYLGLSGSADRLQLNTSHLRTPARRKSVEQEDAAV